MVKLHIKAINMNSAIYVRVFLDTVEVEIAENTAILINNKLQPIADVSQKQVKQYWKIPEYFEISLEFRPTVDLNEAFQKIVNQLGNGWEFSDPVGEKWAVWNSLETTQFFIPRVRWASVEIVS